MQIACKRYSCQKAVEVCYWSCKFRRNCKDWQNAIAGEPGLVAIQSRLEAAAAKSGRAFDTQTLVLKGSTARSSQQRPLASPETTAAAAKVSVVSRPALSVQSTLGTRSDVAMLSRAQNAVSSTTENNLQANKPAANNGQGKKKMAKTVTEHNNGAGEATAETASEKPAVVKAPKDKPKAPRAKQPTNGKVYLLLSKNGKYKELRESDLLTQAATLLKDPSLRLVKGQLLVPTISFQAAEE